MAVDTAQLLKDAECILACVPPGMIEAAQLATSVQLSQATVVTAKVVAVSTNGVKILDANPKRRMAVVENTGGATLAYVGPSTVTTSGPTTGLQLGSVLNENARIFVYDTGELYAASTGVNIHVLEFSLP
jgi:hypothetical protein